MNIKLVNLKSSFFSENIYSTEPTEDLIMSIQDNGVLQPIWISPDNVIIAGHRRVNACKILNMEEIPAEIKEYSDLLVIESNRYRVKTGTETLREGKALREIESRKAKERQGTRTDIVVNFPLSEPGKTRDKVAEQLGMSGKQLEKLELIEKENPEALKRIDAGLSTVSREFNKILVEEQREERLNNKALPLPTGKYRTIVIDVPWPIDKINRDVRPNQNVMDYPTMTIQEIKTFPIRDIAYEEGCHIYLWTTHKFLPTAFEVFNAWGVKYECLLTWIKNVGMTPFSFMYSTEHVLFGRIGSLELLKKGKRLDFQAKTCGHSRKPDVFYELVKEVSPEPRIDVFSRGGREGFDQYGNEI